MTDGLLMLTYADLGTIDVASGRHDEAAYEMRGEHIPAAIVSIPAGKAYLPDGITRATGSFLKYTSTAVAWAET